MVHPDDAGGGTPIVPMNVLVLERVSRKASPRDILRAGRVPSLRFGISDLLHFLQPFNQLLRQIVF